LQLGYDSLLVGNYNFNFHWKKNLKLMM